MGFMGYRTRNIDRIAYRQTKMKGHHMKANLILCWSVLGLIPILSVTTSGQSTASSISSPSGWAVPNPPPDFKGTMKLDIRDSKADWGPFTRKKAPEGAPNILIILYDDTGLAAWSPYGGRINMPTLDKLAANGL